MLHQAYSQAYLSELPGWNARLQCREHQQALAEIVEEEDDIRYAWEWALHEGCLELLSNAVEGLCRYYLLGARYEQGLMLSQLAEGSAPENGWPRHLWMRFHLWQAQFSLLQGEEAQAIALIQPLLPALDDPHETCDEDLAFTCLVSAGVLSKKDNPQALQLVVRGLALYQQLQKSWYIGWALLTLSDVYDAVWNSKLRLQYARDAQVALQAFGDPALLQRVRMRIDFSAILAGEIHPEAQAFITAQTEYYLHLGSPRQQIRMFFQFGICQFHIGKFNEYLNLSTVHGSRVKCLFRDWYIPF